MQSFTNPRFEPPLQLLARRSSKKSHLFVLLCVQQLPVNWEIIFEKFPAPVLPGQDPVEERIANPGSSINDVKGRLEIMDFLFELGKLRRVFISNPAGIHRIHIDASFARSSADVWVIMFRAAFAMFVCGCLSSFLNLKNFPSMAVTLTICFCPV